MPEVVLKIKEKSFRLAFGLELFRILGRKWDLPGINEVLVKIALIEGLKANPTFEQMDILEDLLFSAIINAEGEDVDLKGVKILDEFLKNPENMDNFLKSLTDSLPQNKPDEKEGKSESRSSKKA